MTNMRYACKSYIYVTYQIKLQTGRSVRKVTCRPAWRCEEVGGGRGGGTGGNGGAGGEAARSSRAQHKAQRCSPVDLRTLYKQGHFAATESCKYSLQSSEVCELLVRGEARLKKREAPACKAAMVSF